MKFKYASSFLICSVLASCVYHDSEVLSAMCLDSDLTLSVSAIADVSSCGAGDGSIAVLAEGGVGSYQYRINEELFQASPTFSNLPEGAYSVSVTDDNGCVATVLAPVNNAQSTIELAINTTADTGCATANGTITVSATGGQEPYQYAINSGLFQANSSFTDLAGGDYSITVMDATDCPTSGSAIVDRLGPQFLADVNPIIATKCAISGCHNGSRSPNLSTYAGVKANVSVIKSKITNKSMPPGNSSGGALSQEQINMITCWINDGAAQN
jgi:hypothetical protein